MPGNRIETADFREQSLVAWRAARLLLMKGHAAQWPPRTPRDTDILAFVNRVEPEHEAVYAVIEDESDVLMAAAHVIHNSTVSLTAGRLHQRVEPYTFVVDYAVEPFGDFMATEREMMAHVAAQAIDHGDSCVALTTLDSDSARHLIGMGFMGTIELMGAPSSLILANCTPELASGV